MALNAAEVWEIRTAGNDTNGGAFRAGGSGTDYSQQDGKRTAGDITNISVTDAVAIGTGVITSATANFTAAIVHNVIYLAGGTGGLTGGWYEVTARASATSITVDRNVAAGTGITMNIGGALASPGVIGAVAVASNKIWIKAGTYTLNAAPTVNTSGGHVSPTAASFWEGYQNARGDLGTKPVIAVNDAEVGGTFTVLAGSLATALMYINLSVDGKSKTAITAIMLPYYARAYRCKASNTTVSGITSAAGGQAYCVSCEVVGFSGTAGIDGTNMAVDGCDAHGGTTVGILPGVRPVSFCKSYNNSGATSDGFQGPVAGQAVLRNCVAYANGRDGFRLAPSSSHNILIDCISEGNVGYSFYSTSNAVQSLIINCAQYNNGTGITNLPSQYNFVNIADGSPFVNAAGGNFALNATALRGALCRAAGVPGVCPDGTTTGYLDIGAAQHADPMSGGGFPVLGGSVVR